MDKAGIKQRIREKRMQKMQDRALSSAKILGSLPKSIDPLTLASFRIDEIHEMERDLKEARFNKKRSLFQTLPKHLRRRAASHNSKRLPKALRPSKDADLPMGLGKKPKKFHLHAPLLSARQRASEYKSRQTGCKWLETHIWHAKRFRMQEYWGFKVASLSNQKVFRFNYRMGQEGCCIHDFSYMRAFSFGEGEIRAFVAERCIGNVCLEGKGAFTCTLNDYSSVVYGARVKEEWIVLLHPSCSIEGLKAAEWNVFEVFGDASVSTLEKLELEGIDSVAFPSPFKLTSQYFLLFIPKGKGKETWRKMIYANCKPFSLEDKFHFYFENAAFMFPDFHSARSQAFMQLMREKALVLERKWNAKPPAKRVNYHKLGITSPFTLLALAGDGKVEYEFVFIEALAGGVPLYNGILMQGSEIIGSVVHGNFSLNRGKGLGVALIKREKVRENAVLLCRNIDSPSEHSFECRMIQ